MSTRQNKFRLTQSLMSAFEWSFKTEDGYDDFIRALNRQPKQPTTSMLLGTQYENILNSVLDGQELPEDHEWFKPIMEMAAELDGAQQQVVLFRDIKVDGVNFLIHGVLDYLKAGHVFDCKFSQRYHLNKYAWWNTPQTSFYLYLVPEAMDMTYIISDGKEVFRERYPRDIVEPIEPRIKNFMRFLEKQNLIDTYTEKWRVSN